MKYEDFGMNKQEAEKFMLNAKKAFDRSYQLADEEKKETMMRMWNSIEKNWKERGWIPVAEIDDCDDEFDDEDDDDDED